MSNNEQQSAGFELYHIPQQSRRDKLRFTAPVICSLNSYEQQEEEPATASTQISLTHNNDINNQQEGGCIGYLPLYDPSSLFPPDLLSTHPQGFSHLHHLFTSSSSSEHQQPPSIMRATNQNPSSSSSNFLKGVSNTGNNNYFMATAYADSQYGSTLAAIPGAQTQASTTTENTNSNNNDSNGYPNFLLSREIGHHSASAHELALYKPEPLNLHHHHQQQQGALSLTLSSSSASIHQTTAHHNLATNTSTFARYPAAPVGPFTGYASVLTGSRYLRPAQLLLQEICDLQAQGFADHHGSYPAGFKTGPDMSLLEPPPTTENLRVLEDLVTVGDIGSSSSSADQRDRRVKSRLISMLDEVCRRYKQYYHQLQAVVASFESVPGLSNAAPFANLAFKAMSRQFRSLKSTITDQIQHLTQSPDDLSNMRIEGNNPKSNCSDKIALYGRRPLPVSRSLDNHQPVWRPQRGLPERAVSVLRAWLFEHFLHPYPTDTDKMMLAKQTGLSRSQVSNWFINARVRLWKPMVEEIHALETRQQPPHHQKASTSSQPNNADHRQVASASSPTYHNNYPSTSGLMRPPQENIPPPMKRVRNEILDVPQMSLQYTGQLSSGHGGGGCDIGPGNNSLVGTSNVSLTLALHHQNSSGVGLSSDQYPSIGLAHRFGLNGGNEGCIMGPGFEGPNCHFTRDVIGAGNLLHDFVG